MRSSWSPVLRGAAVAGAVAGSAATAVAWHYSTVLISPGSPTVYPERVRAVTGSTVVLTRNRLVMQPGVWGLRWPTGLAVLGPVLDADRRDVVRELRAGPVPPPGPAVLDVGPFDPDPAARGLAFTEIAVPTPVGPVTAWEVPAGSGTGDWVIAVHGRGGSRREALRVLPALHRAGLHQLVIGYRNDDGAPPSPDGRYHLGDTEWRDLEAAVAYALRRGAQRIVLFGWSMGAAIGGAFLDRSPLAERVAAVVWDAPLLDWRSTLRLQAANRHLPPSLVGLAAGFTGWRIGIDFDRFDLLRHPPSVRPPTLVVHSDADTAVPVGTSRRLSATADALGWSVRYLETAGVEHTASWNADPDRYETVVAGFLRSTLGR